MNSFEKLIYYVEIKNELNRRRRRFLNRTYKKSIQVDINRWEKVEAVKDTHQDKSYWMGRYNETKIEMKSMTKMMRSMRIELGISFYWSSGGMINAVRSANGSYTHHKNFKQISEMYKGEKILLGFED